MSGWSRKLGLSCSVTDSELRGMGLVAILKRQAELVEDLVGLGAKREKIEHSYRVSVIGDGEMRVLTLCAEAVV